MQSRNFFSQRSCIAIFSSVFLIACSSGGGDEPETGVIQDGVTVTTDTDGDEILDSSDNCPLIANNGQVDSDGDGEGDACDTALADFDSDGISDSQDNCRINSNPDQLDTDSDGQGDVCDDSPLGDDTDNDGLLDDEDNCPFTSNSDQSDSDGNGVGDACEAMDPDVDSDGVSNEEDNCPSMPNSDQIDSDQDGTGDVCDPTPLPDIDNDGVADNVDNCVDISNGDQSDTDGDGIGNPCDNTPNGPDSDGDDVPDSSDNCPAIENSDQADGNGDGVGDACTVVAVDPSVLDFLEMDGRFVLFLQAVEDAGYSDIINNSSSAITAFAPTDTVFSELLASDREFVLNDSVGRDAMVQAHLVTVDAFSITDIDNVGGVFSINDTLLTIASDDPILTWESITAPFFTDDSLIVDADISIGRSYVHVVDSVMIDLDDDGGVVDGMVNADNYLQYMQRSLNVVLDELGSNYFNAIEDIASAAEYLGQERRTDIVLTAAVTPEFGGSRGVYECQFNPSTGDVIRGSSGNRGSRLAYRGGRSFTDCGADAEIFYDGTHFETGRTDGSVLDEFNLTRFNGGSSITLTGAVDASNIDRGGAPANVIDVRYSGLSLELNDNAIIFITSISGSFFEFLDVRDQGPTANASLTMQIDGLPQVQVAIDVDYQASRLGDDIGYVGAVTVTGLDGSSALARDALSQANVEIRAPDGTVSIIQGAVCESLRCF